MDADLPKLYRELAGWWSLLSPPAEYAEEAAVYRQSLVAGCEIRPRSVLELGSGGGNNASHLKAHFQLTLVDRSAAMLEVSRALNPECEHLDGDMRSIRLGRAFDGVFVHDAVCYMTTEVDLRQAIETAYLHCAPGGAALFVPDYVRETFRPSTHHGGHDAGGRTDGAGDDQRGLRYLEWVWDPDPKDTTYVVDYAYLLRSASGAVSVEHDRHVEGLFSRADWLRWLSEAGFVPAAVPFGVAELDEGEGELFIARKPRRRP